MSPLYGLAQSPPLPLSLSLASIPFQMIIKFKHTSYKLGLSFLKETNLIRTWIEREERKERKNPASSEEGQ